MKEFKGTKEMFAVEYTGFFYIQDEPFYEGNDVLNFDDDNTVSSEEAARANAKLISAAPELLKALQEILDFPEDDLKGWSEGTEAITITLLPRHIKSGVDAISKALD